MLSAHKPLLLFFPFLVSCSLIGMQRADLMLPRLSASPTDYALAVHGDCNHPNPSTQALAQEETPEEQQRTNHAILSAQDLAQDKAPKGRQRMDLTERVEMKEAAVQKAHRSKKSSKSCCSTVFTRIMYYWHTQELNEYLNSDPRTSLRSRKKSAIDKDLLQHYIEQRKKLELSTKKDQ